MKRLPPLNALRAFEATARLLSFNRAAEALSVTPSAVSHQVKQLEEFFDVRLFTREHRRISLTPAGELLLPGLSGGLEQIASACRTLERATHAPVLTVSVAPTFAMGWLVSRLSAFQVEHPTTEVRLTLTTTQSADHFDNPETDLAIAYGMGEWPDVECERLMTEALVPVCSPALARAERLEAPADVARATLLHALPRICQWRDWLRVAGVTGVNPDRGPKFSTTPLALEAAMAGAGIAIANPEFLRSHLDAGRLVAPFDVDLPSEAGYYLLLRPGRGNDGAVAAFRTWILETIESEPGAAGENVFAHGEDLVA